MSAQEARCPHFGLLVGLTVSFSHLGALTSRLESCDHLGGAALRRMETRLGWEGGALFRLYQDRDTVVLTFLPYDPDAEGAGLVSGQPWPRSPSFCVACSALPGNRRKCTCRDGCPRTAGPTMLSSALQCGSMKRWLGLLLQGAISIVQLQPTSQHRPRQRMVGSRRKRRLMLSRICAGFSGSRCSRIGCHRDAPPSTLPSIDGR
jgi:hypothetical protein